MQSLKLDQKAKRENMMTRPRKFIQEYNPTASIIIIPVFVAVINQKIQNNIAKIIITKTDNDNDDDDEEMLICRHTQRAVDHPRKNDISSKLQCAMYLFHVHKKI